jgi:O-antigen/teichoic acid export membrane protein
MVIGVLMIGWVEPGELGIWQSLSVFQLYLPFLELGIPNGLNRELPYLYGKGEQSQALTLAQTAQAYMICVAMVLFIATILAVIFLLLSNSEMKIVAGAGTAGLMCSLMAYERYLMVTFRSSESFLSLSKIYLFHSFFQLAVFPIVFYINYYGLLIYSLLVLSALVVLMHINRPIRERLVFSKESFKLLMRTGLPVFGMGYLRGVSTSFTRLILLSKAGAVSVGLFTPANAIGSLIILVPKVLGNFFFPKMNFRLGATNDPKQLWPIALKLNGVMLVLGVPFVACIWLISPYLMNTFFPDYRESTLAMQLFAFNFIFAGTLVSHNVIYVVKKYSYGYVYAFVDFLLKFACPYICINYFEGNILALAAIGVVSSNFVLFGLNLFLIRLALFKN